MRQSVGWGKSAIKRGITGGNEKGHMTICDTALNACF